MKNNSTEYIDNGKDIFLMGKNVRFLPYERNITTESGAIINLSENSSRFLSLILKGETEKQKIIDQVWHEQRGQVSDSSYYCQIHTLRRVLDSSGLSGTLIKTIPRKGIKYVGEVVREELSEVLSKDKELGVPEERAQESAIDKIPVANGKGPDQSIKHHEWYRSKQWNALVSILAVLAMCWLTTLVMVIFYFFFPR